MRIDQALGRIPEPLVPLEHVEEITAKMEFDGTIDSLEAIWAVFNELLGRVLTQLERRGHGVRQLDVDFLQHYAPPVRKSIQLSRPSRDPLNIFNLFRTAIEGGLGDKGTRRQGDKARRQRRLTSVSSSASQTVPLSSPSGLRLVVAVHERMTDEQVRLLDGETYAGQLELDRLVERLCARLGDKSVVRPKLFESYVPERAWRAEEEDKGTRERGDKGTKKRKSVSSPCPLVPLSPCLSPTPHRPLHLFPMPREIRVLAEPNDDAEGRPRQFACDGRVYELTCAVGPERIAGEWWRGHVKTRDYYDVADESGKRFWVFRVVTRRILKTPQGQEVRASARWFWHGVFE
jgi:protein ImuB